jgi:uracil-DNA glycosylase
MRKLRVHQSWEKILQEAYAQLSPEYRRFLEEENGYFPAYPDYLNAFVTLPKERVKYILFGQDPYPRKESAGGYAFIDKKVTHLFSPTGLSKEVNRATSLRNFMKMLFVARGSLTTTLTQDAIAKIDKSPLIDSIDALRLHFEREGVLLLNTALVFTKKEDSRYHIRQWQPFMASLLGALEGEGIVLILFGTHAKALKKALPLEGFESLEMPHPYNQSFIFDKNALNCFTPMNLLEK